MSALALSQIGIALLVFLIGHLLIKVLGLGLPKSTSASELFWRAFWIYRSDIPRDLIRKNHFAYLLVVIVAYIVTSIYRANLPAE